MSQAGTAGADSYGATGPMTGRIHPTLVTPMNRARSFLPLLLLAAAIADAHAAEPIATDRPDFVESSQTVGIHRVQRVIAKLSGGKFLDGAQRHSLGHRQPLVLAHAGDMAVEDGDVTLVPKGYHPCATIHGYDLYYLNVMAGPMRKWRFANHPDHDWIFKRDNP